MSKYADHLPLYRQAQIYARQGIGYTAGARLNFFPLYALKGRASRFSAGLDVSFHHYCWAIVQNQRSSKVHGAIFPKYVIPAIVLGYGL